VIPENAHASAVVKMRGVNAFDSGQHQPWHGADAVRGGRRKQADGAAAYVLSIIDAAGLRLTLSQGWSHSGPYARVHKAAGAA